MTEIGLVDEGLAMLERAIAIDPECAGATNQLARIRGIFGGRAVLLHWLGDIPKSPHDIAPWLLLQARDAMWRRDTEALTALAKLLSEVTIPQSSRFPIQSLIDVALGNAARLLTADHLARVLPVDASRPPRRAAFNAQLRSEIFMSIGDHTQALEALKTADSNGFFDVVFLDRCPLLEPIRSHPEFIGVRARVGERAKRVIASIRSGTAG
jgi:serine/threonine-protein kinase